MATRSRSGHLHAFRHDQAVQVPRFLGQKPGSTNRRLTVYASRDTTEAPTVNVQIVQPHVTGTEVELDRAAAERLCDWLGEWLADQVMRDLRKEQ